jgi:hypothetical protein
MPKPSEQRPSPLTELTKAIDSEPGDRGRLERILREAKERGLQQPGTIRITLPSKRG